MWGKGAFIATMLAIAAIIPASAAGVQNARQQGPITISECRSIDQPGPYRLVNNLKAAGNCLVVTSEGVTIDLVGFAISGDGTEPGSWSNRRAERFRKRGSSCGTATSQTSRRR